MLKKRINNWFTHFKKYFFTYKDGFFELNCLYNSPESMIESLKKMPFNKIDSKGQIVKSDNFFFNGELHYQELEAGLWVMYADMSYKTNVSFKMIYDEYLSVDYFALSYNIIENKLFKDRPKNIDINYSNETWSLSKPKSAHVDSHLKDSKVKNVMIYFTEKWLRHNVFNDSRFENNSFNDFFNSDAPKNIIWSADSDFINIEYHEIVKNIQEKGNQGIANVFALKFKIYKYIQDFFLKENNNLKLNSNLLRGDILKQLEIENFLMKNLKSKFIGVDYLSKNFKISPTKLKSDFKEAFGESLLQYFQKKQMQLAKGLIENKDIKISDLALEFGYENPSKFARAFFKHNGELPSFYKK